MNQPLEIVRLGQRITELEAERDNIKAYVSHTEAAEKWYLDGEITWKEFAECAEKGWKRAEAEVERLRDWLDWISAAPENPDKVQQWVTRALAGEPINVEQTLREIKPPGPETTKEADPSGKKPLYWMTKGWKGYTRPEEDE